MGSSFHRQGAAYRKERLVIFKWIGGRERVTIGEERVLTRLNRNQVEKDEFSIDGEKSAMMMRRRPLADLTMVCILTYR